VSSFSKKIKLIHYFYQFCFTCNLAVRLRTVVRTRVPTWDLAVVLEGLSSTVQAHWRRLLLSCYLFIKKNRRYSSSIGIFTQHG